jgi:DNA-binding transcriptional regulator YiaG
MKERYQSEQLMVCHQEAQALFEIGAIDADRMKEFDEMCLVPEAKATPSTHKIPTPAFTSSR